MISRLLAAIAGLLLLVGSEQTAHAAATELPVVQCFQQASGPLSSGSLNFYVPQTTAPKTIWGNAGQTVQLTNPVQLDSSGCFASIFGTGSYRMQVWTGPVVGGVTTGNLLYDVTVTDTSANNNYFWSGLAGGSPNVITITDPGFNATDGSQIAFIALATNTGATTLNPSGYGAYPVLKATTAGLVALTGGEIVQGNPISVVFSATNAAFLLLNPPIQSPAASSAPLCGAVGYNATNDAVTPNYIIDIGSTSAVTNVVMNTPTGLSINRSNVVTKINFQINGAGGLDTGSIAESTIYYIYLIDNGAATAGLASLSATNPTLPANYTYVCRVGAWSTSNSAATLLNLAALGNLTLAVTTLPGTQGFFSTSGITGNCNTTFTATLLSGVPPTATVGLGQLLIANGVTAGLGRSTTGGVTVYAGNVSGQVETLFFETAFTTPQTIYFCSGGVSNAATIIGWIDAVNVH